jgi:hypothetical protein
MKKNSDKQAHEPHPEDALIDNILNDPNVKPLDEHLADDEDEDENEDDLILGDEDEAAGDEEEFDVELDDEIDDEDLNEDDLIIDADDEIEEDDDL